MSKYSKQSAEFVAIAFNVIGFVFLILSAFALLLLFATDPEGKRSTGFVIHLPVFAANSLAAFGTGAVVQMLLRIDEALRDKSP